MHKPVAVIGAGPAGMMAAIQAAKSHRVRLYEQNQTVGKKLLLTGGGRCNLCSAVSLPVFLDRFIGPKNFIKPALSAFSPQALCDFFEAWGVPLKQEGDRIYPRSDRAEDIRAALLRALEHSGVELCLGQAVEQINVKDGSPSARIAGNWHGFSHIIVATGGVSYPGTGSDGKLLATLSQVEQNAWYPGLVPLYTVEDFRPLMGISLAQAELGYKKMRIRGELLFTHYGLSGPVAMDLSNYLRADLPQTIQLDCLPEMGRDQLEAELFGPVQERFQTLRQQLPQRLLKFLLEPLEGRDLGNLTRAERARALDRFKAMQVRVNTTGKIEQATISLGGVELRSINRKTLEHRQLKGLYFAGECLDIAGPTGGYNLQLAFSTGYLAGRLE